MERHDDLAELRRLRRQVAQQLKAPVDFGRRIRQLRHERSLTLDQLADLAGISKAYLSQIENAQVDPPREDKIRRLEEAFGQRPRSLVELAHLARIPDEVRQRLELLESAFGRAEETLQVALERLGDARRAAKATGSDGHGTDDNMADRRPVTAQVPLINRVAAGYPAEFTDLGYPEGVADEYIGTPPGLDDPNAFAVRVVGDSMEPRYHEGDVVLFSPAAAVRSGDDCYVRFAPECPVAQGATFKRVYFDSEDTGRLQPLNDRYPPTVVPLEHVAGLYKAVFRYEAL